MYYNYQNGILTIYQFVTQEAWADQAALLSKISSSNRNDVEELLNYLNYEIEYIMRPRSAPAR